MEKQGEIKEYAKIRVGRYRKILIAAGITALIAKLFYKSAVALLLFFPVYYFYRKYCVKKEQEERKRRLLREFKDCMEIIEGNLLAGYALENAFLDAGKELKELHGEGGLMQTELEIINRKDNWKLSRMNCVTRAVLRMAACELLYSDVPPRVAINEAVEISLELYRIR